MERYTNVAITTLSAGINSSVTSITVTSAAKFPTLGTFRVLIDNELMIVSSVSGNVFTVTRGAESTTAASHLSGATCALILSKGSVEALRVDQSIVASESSLTEFPEGQLNFGAGSLTRLGSPKNVFGQASLTTTPDTSGWSWVNQGVSQTVSTFGPGYITTKMPQGQSSNAYRSNYLHSASGNTAEAAMTFLHSGGSFYSGYGLASSTNIVGIFIGLEYASNMVRFRTRLFAQTLNATVAPTTRNDTYGSFHAPMVYSKLTISGTTATALISLDGIYYQTTQTLTIPAITPTQIALISTSATGSTPAVNQTTYYSLKVY